MGSLLTIASAALLSAGLFTIFSAILDDDLDLPSEGVLTEILLDVADDGAGGRALRVLDADIGLDKIGPNEVSCRHS